MNTKVYNNEKLIKFFDEVIDEVSMAKHIRRINFILAQTVINENELGNQSNKKMLDSSFYYLNELAEKLDPYLDVE